MHHHIYQSVSMVVLQEDRDDRCAVWHWHFIDHRQGPRITNSGTSHQLWPMTVYHRDNAPLPYLSILNECKTSLLYIYIYMPIPSLGKFMLLNWHNVMMWLTLSYSCNIDIDYIRSSNKSCSICKNSLLSEWLVTTWDDLWAALYMHHIVMWQWWSGVEVFLWWRWK